MEGGGVERDTFHTAIAIKEAGFNSIVISNGGVLGERLGRFGVLHINLPVHTKNPFKIYFNHKKLVKLIEKYKINILHARSRAPAYSAYYACKKAKIPFLTTFHGCHKLGLFGLKEKYNSIMAKGDKVIAVSDFVKEYVANNYKIDKDEIIVIKDGVDLNIFDPDKVSTERKIQVIESFNIEDGKTIITMPARFTKIKGHDLFLKAIADIKKIRNDFACVLLGKAKKKYKKNIIKLIKQLDLEDVVHIREQSNDMPAVYSCSDIIVSSSIVPEAFGLTIAEAQSMGRIVIAPDFGGTAEIVNNNVDGFLFEMGNCDSLRMALNKALSMNLDERKIMSKKAIDNIKNNFTIDVSNEKSMKLYKDILK
ncbi:MAG: Spore coat protein SA [Alphaproteobacteria bacterium ADurb.Bin438]|nr:MAG: Spore coat protein SA [Alphaproteobacteria bacterium ADurb.Bin438]